MIYWWEKLKWRVRKALGLQKKRIKTIDAVTNFGMELFIKLVILFFLIDLALRIGEDLYRLWWWFFPKRHWLPVVPV